MVAESRFTGEKRMTEALIDEIAEEVGRDVKNFLREGFFVAVPPSRSLPVEETAFLEAHGADFTANSRAVAEQRARAQALYQAIVKTSLASDETCRHLKVSGSRLRQRVQSGSLYTLNDGATRLYPRFQFTDSGVLPGLAEVLKALGLRPHPLVVAQFFDTPTEDLQIPGVDGPVSPREFLQSGGDVAQVVRLALDA